MPFLALGGLCQPISALSSLYRLYPDASSKIYLSRVLCRCGFAISASMYPLLHVWRGWNDSERAPGKECLSYSRGAFRVKNKMTQSAWKRRMYNGSNAVFWPLGM